MIRSSLALIAAAMIATSAQAQTGEWPTKPIRLIAPFPPASTADVIGRVLGQKLSQRLGQPVVIDNRVGASGNLGADAIAKAAPDGYTLGIVTSSTHAVAVSLSSKLPYDPLKDFTPITMLANSPYVLVLYPGVPAKDIKELVALAKSKPGTLNYGSAGNGSATHMNAEVFRFAAGLQAQHVPFKGTPEALNETMAGRIDWFFAPMVSALSLVQSGKLKALAVGTAKRSDVLPQLPTTVEAGVPGSEYLFWVGLFAPAKTPAGIVERLHDEVAKIMASADMKERLDKLGAEAFLMSPAAFDKFIVDETAKSQQIVRAAGIKAN
jgi:tripartite-type tricarboxylate transporter receptor subunit TctC